MAEYASARSLVASVSRAKTYSPPKDESTHISHVMDLVAYARHLERSYATLKTTVPASGSDQAESPPVDSAVDPYVSSINRDHDYAEPQEDAEQNQKIEYLGGDGPVPPRFYGPLSNILLVKDAFEEMEIDEDDPDGCDVSTLTTTYTENQEHPYRRLSFWLAPSWTGPLIRDQPRYHEFPLPGMLL